MGTKKWLSILAGIWVLFAGMAAAGEPAGNREALPSWIQNMSMKGDLRLRYQNDWAQGAVNRERARLRLRTGFETRIVENVKTGFGFATGVLKDSGGAGATDVTDAEPRSTNYTFQNEFSKPTLLVDFGYLEYSPVNGVTLIGGKMKNPLWRTTDILFDSDINPDGVAATFEYAPSEQVSLFLTPAWFIIDEIAADASDPGVFIAQPGVSWQINDRFTLKGALAYHAFNIKNKAITVPGLSTTYPNDYTCTNPSLQLSAKELAGPYSVTLFGDYVVNGSTGANNTGYGAGIRVGDEKVNGFGKWQLSYIRRYLEQAAYPDRFPDSDFYGGATNAKGFEVILEMGLTKTLAVSIDYYRADKINDATAATPKSLAQIDLVYKF